MSAVERRTVPRTPRDGWRGFALKLVRFGLAGGLATLLYGLFAVLIHQISDLPPLAVHVIAFVLAIPVSFFGQMLFTFRYRGGRRRALWRFLATSALAFAISSGAVQAAAAWKLHYAVGVVVTMIVVPVVSFFTMLLWVFADGHKRPDTD